MAEPSTIDGIPCVFANCDEFNITCEYICVTDPFLPPPPPPITAPANSSHTVVAPYLIATVCILGISFLLLTTCTIILRYRFSRRRTASTAWFNEPPDGGDQGGSVVDHPIWHIATVGLQQSVIDSITAFKYKKVDGLLIDGSDCSVCLTGFDDGDDLRLLPKCSHAFHLSCIDTWLRSHKNCPLCRAPVVNDDTGVGTGDITVIQVRSGNLGSGQNDEMENLENNNGISVSLGEGGGDSSQQLRERGDAFVELRTEGIKIAEILKKNRELRILSDLGENYRFRGEDEDGVEPIRRSISYNSSASAAIYRTMSDVFPVGNDEGCSSNTDPLVQEKKINVEKVPTWGSSMSGLLTSSSFGRSLQKGPISMKRSFSSGGKLFSFRRTKNQASILPL